MTAGAAVNTVGTQTLLAPASASAASSRSVQVSIWIRLMCGHPMKQSLGLASGFFQMTG